MNKNRETVSNDNFIKRGDNVPTQINVPPMPKVKNSNNISKSDENKTKK